LRIISVPLYRGHALDDWGDTTPGFLQLRKGAFVTVFGVEGKYFDAEVRQSHPMFRSLFNFVDAFVGTNSTGDSIGASLIAW
jgi:hypothetical protein